MLYEKPKKKSKQTKLRNIFNNYTSKISLKFREQNKNQRLISQPDSTT